MPHYLQAQWLTSQKQSAPASTTQVVKNLQLSPCSGLMSLHTSSFSTLTSAPKPFLKAFNAESKMGPFAGHHRCCALERKWLQAGKYVLVACAVEFAVWLVVLLAPLSSSSGNSFQGLVAQVFSFHLLGSTALLQGIHVGQALSQGQLNIGAASPFAGPATALVDTSSPFTRPSL